MGTFRAMDGPANEFIDRASHELRTPLTAILGYAEVLLHESAGLSDEQVKQIQAIQRNAVRLERTIADLMRAAESGVGVGAASWAQKQQRVPDMDG